MKGRRALLNESERARAAWTLGNHLLRFLERRPERTIGVYLSRPHEISLDPTISALLHGGYTVAAPRVDLERGIMSFWRLSSLEDVERGPWNVREPRMEQPVEDIPLIMAPGLAFDPNGGRLGMGGGWYDRYLTQARCVVGVTFDCEIIAEVPLEEHDVKVDFVASESRFIDVNGPDSPYKRKRLYRGVSFPL
ncbi:5-formyltetrahydrofolate cyclo-ligase [bacterium]|nr:MAG: 5-formyltetrahydrofolate cyclo-ligase [bacterium]